MINNTDKKESTQEEPSKITSSATGNFFSPYGVILFTLAIFFDVIGLVLFVLSFFGIGILLSWILDITALLFIGSLMFLKSGKIKTTKKTAQITKKLSKKIFKRIGLSFISEIIPFVGDILPCWTIAVYFHLKEA